MDKVTDMLQKLADKLGVTIQYLWSAYVYQMRIDGMFDIGLTVLLIGVSVWLFKLGLRCGSKDDWDGNPSIVCAFFGSLLCAVFGFIALHSAVSELFNPAIAAFQAIISAIK